MRNRESYLKDRNVERRQVGNIVVFIAFGQRFRASDQDKRERWSIFKV